MKYIKRFSQHTDYLTYELSGDFIRPNVSLCVLQGNNHIHYNPRILFNNEYFTIVARENGTITFSYPTDLSTTSATSMSYSKNNGNWVETNNVANEEVTISVSVLSGDKVCWKGDNTTICDYDNWALSHFTSDCEVDVEGNIMSLLYDDDFSDKTTMESGVTFASLFNYWYDVGEDDPRTDLILNVVSANNLVLPATTLAEGCYEGMFANCTSLTTVPQLPATTLAELCYSSMFDGCASLTTVPELPATTLTLSCYSGMFSGCTSLTTAPELPATTLAIGCYTSMFFECTNLTTAPQLPTTTLADGCYSSMFWGCTSLTTTPELSATTLASQCYKQMFQGCTSLTTAPELPATTLTDWCYFGMFSGCTSLNSITCLATDISASYCTMEWLKDVASNGTFTKAMLMTSWTSGAKGIPTGWTVETVSE